MVYKVPSNPNHSTILGFYDNLPVEKKKKRQKIKKKYLVTAEYQQQKHLCICGRRTTRFFYICLKALFKQEVVAIFLKSCRHGDFGQIGHMYVKLFC